MVLRAFDMHTLMKSLATFRLLSVSYQMCFVFLMIGLKLVFPLFWNTVYKS